MGYSLIVSQSFSRQAAREAANRSRGIPIPGSGRCRCSCYFCSQNSTRNCGVSANSKILPHRYADEGERGPVFRREIRRKEKAMWQAEAFAELEEEFYELMDELDF